MSKDDISLEALRRVGTVDLILGKLKAPLKNVRRLRELREIGAREWLVMQLGSAIVEDRPELPEQILELLETLSRKRGRPRKERLAPLSRHCLQPVEANFPHYLIRHRTQTPHKEWRPIPASVDVIAPGRIGLCQLPESPVSEKIR